MPRIVLALLATPRRLPVQRQLDLILMRAVGERCGPGMSSVCMRLPPVGVSRSQSLFLHPSPCWREGFGNIASRTARLRLDYLCSCPKIVGRPHVPSCQVVR